MKSPSRFVFFALALAPALASAGLVPVTIDSATISNGYMNVSNLPANGGAFQFGSNWGVGDLNATFTNGGTTVNFTPNTIGDAAAYWYTPSGGPGAAGNKIMEANLYAESTGPMAGQTLVFSGNVSAFTLDGAYLFKAFIKDFAPDYSSSVTQEVIINSTGNFSINLLAVNDPTRHVQWGLQMTGVNVWATDVGPKGFVTVNATPVPESSTAAITLGLFAAGFVLLRRRQKSLS